MSVKIVRAFVGFRRFLARHRALARKLAELESRVGNHDNQINALVEAIRQLALPSGEENERKIGFHRGNR
jgi:hypothetical protein